MTSGDAGFRGHRYREGPDSDGSAGRPTGTWGNSDGHSTDPGWTPLFMTAGALVMEMFGVISDGESLPSSTHPHQGTRPAKPDTRSLREEIKAVDSVDEHQLFAALRRSDTGQFVPLSMIHPVRQGQQRHKSKGAEELGA